ncbi:hypothetical protein BST97_14725 [Nonlabens spongiae]|uniref:DUF2141 domain-containing protein n=1 Tax=Nonlabens spongiae TaxID=331648 RepID=A0A1W6MNI7_9FLAO|nr:DUF2141 domain-containing protein [Nonlabens spongiae]ARN79137.1 hypothetical protein BST97_14725 [Nonlabens spongiae]
MKTLFTTIIALIIATLTFAQDGNTITVQVLNATSDEGTIEYGIYDQDTFMKAAPVFSASVEIKDGKAVAVFENVPEGDYAIMALHDLNGNGRIDFETNGMPKEAYGMSNNPMSYGPPTWADAKITIDKDQEISIRL